MHTHLFPSFFFSRTNSISSTSAPSADYYPTYVDAAKTLQNESNTKFGQVWVDDSAHIAARFLIPARLPYIVYAKDGQCKYISFLSLSQPLNYETFWKYTTGLTKSHPLLFSL
jgi:hypothetical protein